MEILEIKKHNNGLLIVLSISRNYGYDYPQGIIEMTYRLSKSICEACGQPAFSKFIGCSKCKSYSIKRKSDKSKMVASSLDGQSYEILTDLIETLACSIKDIKETADLSTEKLKATVFSGALSISYNGDNNMIKAMIDLLEMYYLKFDYNNGVEIAL